MQLAPRSGIWRCNTAATTYFGGVPPAFLISYSADTQGMPLTQNVIGACEFCARSCKVIDAIRDARWPLLADNDGEASIRNLMVEGYHIFSS